MFTSLRSQQVAIITAGGLLGIHSSHMHINIEAWWLSSSWADTTYYIYLSILLTLLQTWSNKSICSVHTMHNLNVSIHDGICLFLSMSVSTVLCLYQHFFVNNIVVTNASLNWRWTLHVESIDGGCKWLTCAMSNKTGGAAYHDLDHPGFNNKLETYPPLYLPDPQIN